MNPSNHSPARPARAGAVAAAARQEASTGQNQGPAQPGRNQGQPANINNAATGTSARTIRRHLHGADGSQLPRCSAKWNNGSGRSGFSGAYPVGTPDPVPARWKTRIPASSLVEDLFSWRRFRKRLAR